MIQSKLRPRRPGSVIVRALFPLLLLMLILPATASGKEAESAVWPQYRGPDRSGISSETGLARGWGEEGPTVLWRQPIGPSFSGVVVAGNDLYTTTSDSEGDYVLRLDATSGKTVWQRKLGPEFVDSFGNGPRVTPTLDGDRLYVLSGQGHLAAMDRDQGKVVWQRDLKEDFGVEIPRWGFASAPLILGDDLILDVGGADAAVVAFDKLNGKVRWKAGQGEGAYGSPVLMEVAGQEQLVLARHNGLMATSLDGRVLWEHSWAPEGGIKPAMPVFVAPNLVFASASYGIGAVAVRLEKSDAGLRAEEVWQSKVMRNHFNSSVLLDGKLYGFDNATLKCIDPSTGEQLWAQRGGLGKGSLIAADGMLIVLTENGTLKLAQATPDGYHELASHAILQDRSWTEPTLADGRLYVRNREEMVALDLRAAAAGSTLGATARRDSTAQPARGASSGELSLEQILAHHRKAVGNAKDLHKAQGLRITGTYEGEGLGRPFTLTLRWPNQYRLEIGDKDEAFVQAYDGEVSWSQAPGQGEVRHLEEPNAGLDAEDMPSFFTPLLATVTGGARLELVGKADLDGRPAHHLRSHLPSGRSQDWYLDTEDYLVRKKGVAAVSRYWGDYTRVYWYHRYRDHGGIKLPDFIERVDDTFVKLFQVQSAESVAELDNTMFLAPEVEAEEADESGR